jgi:hypothetical protein
MTIHRGRDRSALRYCHRFIFAQLIERSGFLLDLDYNKKPLNVQLLYANRDNDFRIEKNLTP